MNRADINFKLILMLKSNYFIFKTTKILKLNYVNKFAIRTYYLKTNLIKNYYISFFIKNEINIPQVSNFFLNYIIKNPTKIIEFIKLNKFRQLCNFFLKKKKDDEFTVELLELVEKGILPNDFLIYHTVFTPLAQDVATVVVLLVPVVVFLYTTGAFMEAVNPPEDYED